jgi:hypothetical protein
MDDCAGMDHEALWWDKLLLFTFGLLTVEWRKGYYGIIL